METTELGLKILSKVAQGFSIHSEARHFPGLSRLLMFAAACDTGWPMYRHCVVSW